MKKKIGIAAAVIIVLACLTGAYFAFLAPKAQPGEKWVVVQVIAEKQSVHRTFSYKTKRAFLSELLEDEKQDLKPEFKNGQYGKFVTGMLGIKADASREFYHIKVDGTDAVTGVSSLPLENGKTYTFTLTSL